MTSIAGERQFLDTNIVVYASDSSHPDKRETAVRVIEQGMRTGRAVLSSQVLGEFWITVTQTIQRPLDIETAQSMIARLSQMMVVPVDAGAVLAAIHFQKRYKISYWDGLIVAAAHAGRCPYLLTEDLNHGQRYGEVIVFNPFAEEMDDHP